MSADETLRTVGRYDMVAKTSSINDSLVYWHGHGVPKDSIDRLDVRQKPNVYIQILLITLAVVGQLLALAFLAVNIKFRKTRLASTASSKVNSQTKIK